MFGPILELAIFILPEYGNGKMLSLVIYDRFQYEGGIKISPILRTVYKWVAREEEKRFVSNDTWAAEVNLRVSCSFTIQSINQRLRCRHFRGKDRLSHLAG